MSIGNDLVPETKMILAGCGEAFFRKATYGHQRDLLNADELRLYDALS